jgi:hypothetical protein
MTTEHFRFSSIKLRPTLISPPVLYTCGTRPFILRGRQHISDFFIFYVPCTDVMISYIDQKIHTIR